MTMVMPRTNISKEITASVKSAYGKRIKVFDTEIPHSIRAVEATAEGKSIFAYDKSGKVAAAYYDFVNADSEDEFNAYIQKCKELALYETGVNAEYGDRLITLSTCEYSAQNGRLVVVAKKVG